MCGRNGVDSGSMGLRRGIRGVRVRRSRTALALGAALLGFGLLSSAVGTGALPAESLPAFGITNGDGSLSTVAALGDVNGDGFGDYAVGLPSSDAGGTDAGIVYVFLGHGGALPASPTGVNLATASFRITGHAGEMLGYSIAGDDVNGDHLADIAIGAPMAGPPSKVGGGAVYVVFGRANPVDVNTTALSPAAYTNAATNPAPPSSVGSRYDGFVGNGHFGMSLAALPDVNGDGFNDLVAGSPDALLHGVTGGVAVLYGKSQGVHITLNDLWEAGYPYFFHVDFPALADQFVGTTVASVGDMTGDHLPDIAIGAPKADFNGADSGSVWIISAHLPPIIGCTQAAPVGTCPWIKLNNLTAGQGYRIDGAAPGDQLGTSLAGVGDQNGDGIRDLAIGAAGASPEGRTGAGEVVVVQGQANQTTRNLAVAPPLQTIDGPAAGAGLGASLAAAGDVDADSRVDMLAGAPGEASTAGAAYLVRGAPNTVSDLGQATSKIASAGAGAQTGSAVAAGLALDGGDSDAIVAAPGAGGSGSWYLVGGSGTPILPPPPPPPAPPPPPPTPPSAPPAAPPAPPATSGTTTTAPAGSVTAVATTATTHAKPVAKKKKKLPLCPLKKPKPKYKIVKGKRVKVKPAPCRARAKTKAKAHTS
jgi:FG-GAP repeat